PMTGVGCCAWAANRHAAAIPMPAMNSRRRMCPPQGPRLWDGSLAPCRTAVTFYWSTASACIRAYAWLECRSGDVGDGSLADMSWPKRDVCLTPDSGHCHHDMECRLRAQADIPIVRGEAQFHNYHLGAAICGVSSPIFAE